MAGQNRDQPLQSWLHGRAVILQSKIMTSPLRGPGVFQILNRFLDRGAQGGRNFTAIEEFFGAHEEEFAPLREELEVAAGADLAAALVKMRGFAVSEELNSGLAGLGLGSTGLRRS
jgi:hypothetical protein